ncbi:hypothetical protein [Spirillospora sp. CA-128828]|uniref:hypothetical protein n=1 Tax=Spirillospora sp. CA-128828 TaxID=3240033 RepID=UPI003D8C2DD0
MPTRSAAVPNSPVDGWTVYRSGEGFRAVCDDDQALTVEHPALSVLADACQRISDPTAQPKITPVSGPGGGINV